MDCIPICSSSLHVNIHGAYFAGDTRPVGVNEASKKGVLPSLLLPHPLTSGGVDGLMSISQLAV